MALANTRVMGELARALLASSGQATVSPQSYERNPRVHVAIVPSPDRWVGPVGYGFIAPTAGCGCCSSGFGYGFASGRLVPHSHFYPTQDAARRSSLFFPGGHQLDAAGFPVGQGYWTY
jgi:hypothetical protein